MILLCIYSRIRYIGGVLVFSVGWDKKRWGQGLFEIVIACRTRYALSMARKAWRLCGCCLLDATDAIYYGGFLQPTLN